MSVWVQWGMGLAENGMVNVGENAGEETVLRLLIRSILIKCIPKRESGIFNPYNYENRSIINGTW